MGGSSAILAQAVILCLDLNLGPRDYYKHSVYAYDIMHLLYSLTKINHKAQFNLKTKSYGPRGGCKKQY